MMIPWTTVQNWTPQVRRVKARTRTPYQVRSFEGDPHEHAARQSRPDYRRQGRARKLRYRSVSGGWGEGGGSVAVDSGERLPTTGVRRSAPRAFERRRGAAGRTRSEV